MKKLFLQISYTFAQFAIILEGGIVMNNLQNQPQAICVLFGLSYALNLDYPKDMKNTLNLEFRGCQCIHF